MGSVTEHTARKTRQCGAYPCRRSIERGERYRRHVAFPGDEGHEEGTRPWVIEECAVCAAARGEPIADPPPVDPAALLADPRAAIRGADRP